MSSQKSKLTQKQIDVWLVKIASASVYTKLSVLKSMPEEMTEHLINELDKHIAFYAAVCHSDVGLEIPPHHREAYSIFESDAKQIGQVWWRGGGKTTCKRIFIMHQICNLKQECIITIQETEKQSKTDMITIKNNFENNAIIRHIYGDLKGDSMWGVEGMIFANGVILLPGATGKSIRGTNIDNFRPTLILLDDFASEKNSKTPESREELNHWLVRVIQPLGVPNVTRFIYMGTIITQLDFLATQNPRAVDENGSPTAAALNSIFRPEVGGAYTEFKVSAIPYDGTTDDIFPTWEAVFPLDAIKSAYNVALSMNDLAGFYQEFYNIAAGQAKPLFNANMLKELKVSYHRFLQIHYVQDPTGRKVPIRLGQGVDPNRRVAVGSDDFIVFTTGRLPDGTYVAVDIYADRIPIEEHASKVIEKIIEYKPYVCTIETQAYQLSLGTQVQELARKNKLHTWIQFYEKNVSKANSYNETDGLATVINADKMMYVTGCPNIEKFKTQLGIYTAGAKRQHDDTIDGAYLSIKELPPPIMYDVDKAIRDARNSLGDNKKKKRKTFMGV